VKGNHAQEDQHCRLRKRCACRPLDRVEGLADVVLGDITEGVPQGEALDLPKSHANLSATLT
jgi:hypothetical protein